MEFMKKINEIMMIEMTVSDFIGKMGRGIAARHWVWELKGWFVVVMPVTIESRLTKS